MNILDILKQYAERPTDTNTDFDEVSRQVAPDVLGQGIAESFRSDSTPAFGSMVGQLFGNSNGSQRAGLLGQLIQAAGPAVLAGVAGGGFGRILEGLRGAGSNPASPPTVSTSDADRMTPDEVEQLAAAAEKNDPTIIDKVGSYYSAHPEVVKVLGGAALAIALGQIATRMQRR